MATRSVKAPKNVSRHSDGFSRLIVGTGVAACLLVAVLALYPVLRGYYIVVRANELLNLELSAVLERNERISEQTKALNTVEGIEDRVREQFGWVHSGEDAVNIPGLQISESTTVLPAVVDAADIQLPSTWWTNFLDTLFVVQTQAEPVVIPDPFLSE